MQLRYHCSFVLKLVANTYHTYYTWLVMSHCVFVLVHVYSSCCTSQYLEDTVHTVHIIQWQACRHVTEVTIHILLNVTIYISLCWYT